MLAASQSLENCPLPNQSERVMQNLFQKCVKTLPDYGLSFEDFQHSLSQTVYKCLILTSRDSVTVSEINKFLRGIFVEDLYLALGCASGNQLAWVHFDQQYRSYMLRIAQYLASSDLEAQEGVDSVYAELWGARVNDGLRNAKFLEYSGRGSLRGFLKTIVWRHVVDRHESQNQWKGGEEFDNSRPNSKFDTSEKSENCRKVLQAFEAAFNKLGMQEKITLLYFHAENLRYDQINKLPIFPSSLLQRCFPKKSAIRKKFVQASESKVIRYLKTIYKKLSSGFILEMELNSNLSQSEIDSCWEIVQDGKVFIAR